MMNPGSCDTGSCGCASGFNGTPSCSASLTTSSGFCTAIGTTIFNATNGSGCLSFNPLSSTTSYDFSTNFAATCNVPSGGTATKVAPTWSVTNAFCAGSRVGGGCAGGQICVPVAANHCVLESGSQAACTVSGYPVQNTTPFYSGFDDSTRACSCVCNPSGSCVGAVGFFSNGVCSGMVASQGEGCYKGWPSYDRAQVFPPSNAACVAGAASSGATSTSGFERTVCCMH
jgi:hypothetical protein